MAQSNRLRDSNEILQAQNITNDIDLQYLKLLNEWQIEV